MKKCNHLIILLICILMILGCGMFNGIADFSGQRTDLYRVALYSIPLGEKFNRIDEDRIETDCYGRTLFYIEISPNNDFYPYTQGQMLVAAMIMQKSDDNSIWFYEDMCFLFGSTTFGTASTKGEYYFEQEKLEEFKVRNDWDQPFCPKKCSSRPYFPNGNDYDGMDMKYYGVEITQWIRHYKKNDDMNVVIDLSWINRDKNGKELYWISFREDSTADAEHFLVIYDPKSTLYSEERLLKVESLDFADALHEMKVRNSWAFGGIDDDVKTNY